MDVKYLVDQDVHRRFMRLALNEARTAAHQGEVPVGAVVTCNGRVIASAHNMTEALNDVTAHAEMLAITSAATAMGGKYLTDCVLYVTVEPCLMCAGALAWARPAAVVWGADDPKRGYAVQVSKRPYHPKTAVVKGVLADEAAAIMTEFFKNKR